MTQTGWDPPGPGTWERDSAHFDRTVSRPMVELMEQAAPEGMRQGFDLIGAPLATIDVRFVNGQMYRRLVPIIGASGRGPSKPPPPWLMRAVFALHPRLRRRARTAEESLDQKSWTAEADRWEREWKPSIVATNRRLTGVDVTALSDEELAEHLDDVFAHLRHTMTLHFRLHISDLGPIALLLDHADEWGLSPADVMAALAGASPSTSAPQDALRPLAREVTAAPSPPESLDEIRRVSDRAAALLDDFLIEFGSRLTSGYDVTRCTLGEMPGVVVAMLRDPRLLDDRTAAESASARGDDALLVLRTQVPELHRDEFDELVADARRLYGLRDENGPLTAEWPCGVLRVALVETGRRFVASGRLRQPVHVFDLGAQEIVGALRGEPGPHATAVATRHRVRMEQGESAAPPFLGPEPVEPDLDGLPDAMARMMRMTVHAVALLEADDAHAEMFGTGVGTSSYTGRARVVVDADDAVERCEPGDVVITRFTAPTFNSVLAMAGAVVTEQGGLLCHTAVIARELGIAAVVGVHGALDIPDGAQVQVDPVAGAITVVDVG